MQAWTRQVFQRNCILKLSYDFLLKRDKISRPVYFYLIMEQTEYECYIIEGVGEERKIGEKTQRKIKVVQENCGIIEETKIKKEDTKQRNEKVAS